MVQYEFLVLPGIISIIAGLMWILFLVKDTLPRINRTLRSISCALAVISIVLFLISLSIIIDHLSLEAPAKNWAATFFWGWILISISFFVIYAGYLTGDAGKGG